jgi:hypothetical protein
MSEKGPWTPAAVDPIAMARQRMATKTGEVILQNDSNRFWGHVVPWALLAMAVLMLNKSSLTDVDPLTPGELFVAAIALASTSLTVYVVIGRPRVSLRGGIAKVRNPIWVYEFHLSRVQSVEETFWGFTKLTLPDRVIRVVGMEESLATKLAGGSMERALLEAEIAAYAARSELERSGAVAARKKQQPVVRKPAVVDLSSWPLLFGWLLYAGSFAV